MLFFLFLLILWSRGWIKMNDVMNDDVSHKLNRRFFWDVNFAWSRETLLFYLGHFTSFLTENILNISHQYIFDTFEFPFVSYVILYDLQEQIGVNCNVVFIRSFFFLAFNIFKNVTAFPDELYKFIDI